MTTCVEITVCFSCGTHQTNTVRGVRASSTSSWLDAAESFGRKYFGPAFRDAAHLRDNRWTVTGDARWYAWCWASGLIEMGPKAPPARRDGGGAIVIASGPMRALQEAIGVLARHGQGKSAGKLLVPGVPEAANQAAGATALAAWLKWCGQRNGQRDSYGVVFRTKGATR